MPSTSLPTKCHLWKSLPSKDKLFSAFQDVKNYRNDYHNTRDLKRCKKCGQLYFHEFYEEVDFRDGDDREYNCFIPVDSVDAADELNKLSRFQLTRFSSIFLNFPPYDSKPYWNNRGDDD